MNRSTPGLPVHHQLPEFTQTHVHLVSDAIQPSHPLSSPSPPALNPSQHQSLFQWVNSSHEVAKVLEFQLQLQLQIYDAGAEIPGLISFRMDWLDLLAVQGTLKSLLQHHSSKASILWLSAFFTVQLSHPYMTTGKTIALTRRTFVGKVMSLLLNMLSRLDITFLPRSKRLLFFIFFNLILFFNFTILYWFCHILKWLQSASAVTLFVCLFFAFFKKFYYYYFFCSDFGAQKNKLWHCFPIYFPWSDGTGCHDLCFLNVEL